MFTYRPAERLKRTESILEANRQAELKIWEEEFVDLLHNQDLHNLGDLYEHYTTELQEISGYFSDFCSTKVGKQSFIYLNLLTEELQFSYNEHDPFFWVDNSPGQLVMEYEKITDTARTTRRIPTSIQQASNKLRNTLFAARALKKLHQSVNDPLHLNYAQYEKNSLDFMRKGIDSTLSSSSIWLDRLIMPIIFIITAVAPFLLSYFNTPRMFKQELNGRELAILFQNIAENSLSSNSENPPLLPPRSSHIR